MTFKVIARNLLNLVYPVHCAGCGKSMPADSGQPVCGACRGQVKAWARPGRSAGRRGQYFTEALSACVHDGVLKELVHSFKYHGKISLAGPLSFYMIALASREKGLLEGINAVSFVPAQDSIVARRDYNHSQVLAGRIAREFGLPLVDALKKARRTRPQNELSRDERLVNLIGAFSIKDRLAVDSMKILLIDDVTTTGATLDECAKILLENGASEVRCLTLSRGI